MVLLAGLALIGAGSAYGWNGMADADAYASGCAYGDDFAVVIPDTFAYANTCGCCEVAEAGANLLVQSGEFGCLPDLATVDGSGYALAKGEDVALAYTDVSGYTNTCYCCEQAMGSSWSSAFAC